MPQSDVPVMGSTEDQLGVSITLVTLFSIDPDEEERGLRALLELKKKTELEQAARVQVANTDAEVKVIEAKADKEVAVLAGQAEKEVGILVNDVAADKVTRVVLPIAQTPGGPQVRFAEAYEKNETVTIFAPGGDGMGLIIQPEKK
jgi:regulator of protease activity HflC (stomatin/prohibitin superfamily)